MLSRTELTATARAIAGMQLDDGAIPWGPGRHVDPWDHVESAMGLDVMGLSDRAEAAYRWLAETQRSDGSWPAAIAGSEVLDATLDANFCAYVAVGAWHHFMCTSDEGSLRRLWRTVERAIDFALDLQMPSGAIAWARDPAYRAWPRALVTSSACIHLSLWCAVTIAEHLDRDRPDWELSLSALAHALRDGGDDFEPKDLYAMDWYYPVLGGAVRGVDGRNRLQERWDRFVVPDRGVLCTSDKAWVTTGETCEVVLTCASLGMLDEAAQLFDWVQHLRADDALYWTGANHPDTAIWPIEKTSWSAGSVLMAADALQEGPTLSLFRGDALAPAPDLESLPALES